MMWLRVIVSLGVVLALLWWLHRRLTTGSRAGGAAPVTVIAKQGIGSKASVVVIDVEGSRLVLGVTEQSVSVLQTADAPAPVTDFATAMDAAVTGTPAPINLFRSAQFGGTSPIAGSILSPDTWRQAATTLRRAR